MKVVFILSCLLAGPSQSQDKGGPDTPCITMESVNPGLSGAGDNDLAQRLETPQGCLEYYLERCRREAFAEAAHAMHFRLLEPIKKPRAAELAEKLHYVLRQELYIDWSRIPDRPDGMLEGTYLTDSDPMMGKARKSLSIGAIKLDGRTIPIRLDRLCVENAAPLWLFSAYTVDNIERLYERHGPRWLDRKMPDWLRARGWGNIAIWKWIVAVLALAAAPVIAYFGATLIKSLLLRRLTVNGDLPDSLMWPMTAVLGASFLFLMFEVGLSLPGPIAVAAETLILMAVVGSIAWLIMSTLDLIVEHGAKRAIRKHYKESNAVKERSLLTQITITRHVLMLVVCLAAIGILLVQLDMFRTLGIALLSSAGAAAVVLGIAGHAVLGNLIAGLQIALAKPFTLGDTVLVEGNWGTIESISYTYVMVKTWDHRRLVLPIKYFTDRWFENWSMTDPYMIQSIYLYLDYRADIEAVRRRFTELIDGEEELAPDRDEPEVLVVETSEKTMKVRLTCPGKDASDAWALRCRIHEAMIAWLQDVEGGAYLPQHRLQVHSEGLSESDQKPRKNEESGD